MTARTHQRRLAILAVLHEEGPCYASELETATQARSGTLYPALAFLEKDAGLIIGEWESDNPDLPARVVYRITTKDERAQHAMFGPAGTPVPQRRSHGGAR